MSASFVRGSVGLWKFTHAVRYTVTHTAEARSHIVFTHLPTPQGQEGSK